MYGIPALAVPLDGLAVNDEDVPGQVLVLPHTTMRVCHPTLTPVTISNDVMSHTAVTSRLEERSDTVLLKPTITVNVVECRPWLVECVLTTMRPSWQRQSYILTS